MGRSEINSILLRPIMRWPFQSTEEYRDETLVTGSPMVFQTAPPQPASKARMICSPQLVGGAEASQKGLGELMLPANPRTRMSGIHGLRDLQHGQGRALAVGHSIHDFPAAVGAIAAGEVTRIAGLSR